MTNDGGLARRLELPATGWTRRYRVRAYGAVEPAALADLAKGVRIDGIDYGPIEARLERQTGRNAWIAMALKEGKNREVRRVLEHLGLTVNRLIRVAFGPFQLGALPVGAIVVETATGRELWRLPHQGHVRSVVFSPDGKRVATGSADASGHASVGLALTSDPVSIALVKGLAAGVVRPGGSPPRCEPFAGGPSRRGPDGAWVRWPDAGRIEHAHQTRDPWRGHGLRPRARRTGGGQDA